MERLSIQKIKELLSYDPKSGALQWKPRKDDARWTARYAGKVAFSKNSDGYLDGYILRSKPKGKMYRAHIVAWALYHDEWPDGVIDHINGVRNDNRIENLRVVSGQQNARNRKISKKNKTGVTGVTRHKERWRCQIRHDGRQKHLGVFDTFEEACAARLNAEKLYGYSPLHGLHPDERNNRHNGGPAMGDAA